MPLVTSLEYTCVSRTGSYLCLLERHTTWRQVVELGDEPVRSTQTCTQNQHNIAVLSFQAEKITHASKQCSIDTHMSGFLSETHLSLTTPFSIFRPFFLLAGQAVLAQWLRLLLARSIAYPDPPEPSSIMVSMLRAKEVFSEQLKACGDALSCDLVTARCLCCTRLMRTMRCSGIKRRV
jgi:hypothetical protein